MTNPRSVQIRAVLYDPAPVSINQLYSSTATRRFLTNKGRAFKEALTAKVAQATWDSPIPWPSVVDMVYKEGGHVDLEILLVLRKILNNSWKPGRVTESGKPQSPYQQIDTTNYTKLIEDAVVLGTGIDDSAHITVATTKIEDPLQPRVEIVYTVIGGVLPSQTELTL